MSNFLIGPCGSWADWALQRNSTGIRRSALCPGQPAQDDPARPRDARGFAGLPHPATLPTYYATSIPPTTVVAWHGGCNPLTRGLLLTIRAMLAHCRR